MIRPRRQKDATTTEASRVYDALIEPKPEDGGWSAVCPRHHALLQVRVRVGRLDSIHCSASAECPEVERLKGLAAQ